MAAQKKHRLEFSLQSSFANGEIHQGKHVEWNTPQTLAFRATLSQIVKRVENLSFAQYHSLPLVYSAQYHPHPDFFDLSLLSLARLPHPASSPLSLLSGLSRWHLLSRT